MLELSRIRLSASANAALAELWLAGIDHFLAGLTPKDQLMCWATL